MRLARRRRRPGGKRVAPAHRDFPFPMTMMVGGWEVVPADHGAEVTLWYEYTLKGGVFGEILAALMTPALEERMTPVLRNLEATAAAGGSVRPQSV